MKFTPAVSVELALVLSRAKQAVADMDGAGTRFDVCLTALRAAFNEEMVVDLDTKFKAALVTLIDHFGDDSNETRTIMKEQTAWNFIASKMKGVPVDWSQMPQLDEGEKSLGLHNIWRALVKGEDPENLRESIEGKPAEPEKKGAPDWFRNDPDKAWADFVGMDEECSRLGRVLSNIEFQRDWLKKAFEKLGFYVVLPHPEHPDDVDHKNRCLDSLVKEFSKLTGGVQNLKDRLRDAFQGDDGTVPA